VPTYGKGAEQVIYSDVPFPGEKKNRKKIESSEDNNKKNDERLERCQHMPYAKGAEQVMFFFFEGWVRSVGRQKTTAREHMEYHCSIRMHIEYIVFSVYIYTKSSCM
jgi:hypothetical protein